MIKSNQIKSLAAKFEIKLAQATEEPQNTMPSHVVQMNESDTISDEELIRKVQWVLTLAHIITDVYKEVNITQPTQVKSRQQALKVIKQLQYIDFNYLNGTEALKFLLQF